jgi:hypothetical protein
MMKKRKGLVSLIPWLARRSLARPTWRLLRLVIPWRFKSHSRVGASNGCCCYSLVKRLSLERL